MSLSFFGARAVDPDHTEFRLRAPGHQLVEVELASGERFPLAHEGGEPGSHSATLPVRAHARYRFRLSGSTGTSYVGLFGALLHAPVLRSAADQDASTSFYRDLLKLRTRETVPGLEGARTVTSRVLGGKAVEAAWRLGDGSLMVIATNLGDAPLAWTHFFDDAHLLYSTAGPAHGGMLEAFCTVAYRVALPADLARLAQAAGVQVEWVDNQDRPRFVTEQTVRSVLVALGHPNDDGNQIAASIEAIASGAHGRGLLTGRVGETLFVPLPATPADSALHAVLALEDGTVRELDLNAEEDAKGRHRVALQVDEPGYHVLRLSMGPHRQETRLAIAPLRAYSCEGGPCWGTALQLYSLRAESKSEGLDAGAGDYGLLADFAARAGRAGADALAVSPTHAGFAADPTQFSPYSPSSRLFYNVGYIDPVTEFGTELSARCARAAGVADTLGSLSAAPEIDWSRSLGAKMRWLRAIFDDLQPADVPLTGPLRHHAIFEALHAHFVAQGIWDWREWPAGLRNPNAQDVDAFAAEHASEVRFHAWLQALASAGLARAQRAARHGGMRIGLVSDMAIGMSSVGSHAWSEQAQVVGGLEVGAPPDKFNPNGQSWGLATFSPTALIDSGFEPFISTLRAVLAHAGGVRVDHILGIKRLWLVPRGMSARQGAYVQYPFEDLMNLLVLESHRHAAVVIGEDLGTVPPGFGEALQERGIFGMSVLWFERTAEGGFTPPAEWRAVSVAMTTTHDLPTAAGWWQGRDIEWKHELQDPGGSEAAREARAAERRFLSAAVQDADPAADGVDLAIEVVARAPSSLAIVPIEDLLGLVEQPNIPGTMNEQHPNWRRRLPLPTDLLFEDQALARRVARLDRLRRRSSP